jgi:hypothetical protein
LESGGDETLLRRKVIRIVNLSFSSGDSSSGVDVLLFAVGSGFTPGSFKSDGPRREILRDA